MKIKPNLLYVLICMLIQHPALASLTATLDKRQTSLDQPVQLTIISDQKQSAQGLDTSPLEQDFHIIGRSTSSEIATQNGVASIKTTILMILMARHEGELDIPILSLGADQTEPLSLTVTAASAPAASADEDTPGVFIETIWEHSGKTYVQSQINLLIRIYHQGNLIEAALDEPRAQNTLIKRIGDDVPGVHSRQGIQYQTIERRYALFPQKSGILTVAPVALQVRLPDPGQQSSRRFGLGSFIRGKQLTLRSEPLSVDVLPPAREFKGPTWLPSTQATLKRQGMPKQAINEGDAINMQIDLSALNITGAQLPEIRFPNLNNQFKLYPDTPTFSDTSADGKIIKGTRTQTFVLIASEAGALEIPEISVAWWDVKNDRQQYAKLAAVSIEALPVESGTENVTGDSTVTADTVSQHNESDPEPGQKILPHAKTDSFWKWFSLISFSGWLLSITWFIFYYARNRQTCAGSSATPRSRDLSKLIEHIRNAADNNDAQKTWQALQEYARARWPQHPPGTPEEWAQKTGLSSGAQALSELEEYLFHRSDNSDWNGQAMRRLLLPKLDARSSGSEHTHSAGVPEMYPSA